ncbi:MAG: hypothetical protein ABW318_09120 [Vicinamibacterales bacterium]|jgi:hypothetical protein
MSAINLSAGRDGLWAITSYWNPMRYRRKLANYRLFRERLGVPLIAVELAYGEEFELGEDDAEILVRRRGRDILWQKERLLNIALQALPQSCCKIAWVDCDVVFEAPDWAERTSLLLDRAALVQPFSRLHRMPTDWRPEHGPRPAGELLRSVAFLIASEMPAATCLGTPFSRTACTPGYVWAADRALLQRHGLYDACIIGGADSAVVRAAYGHFEDALRLQYLNRDHYLAWAEPFYAAVRGGIACLDGNLFHLWHGDTVHRRYRERLEVLNWFQFDPFADIAVDDGGVWRWSSDKRAMHDYVRDYFAARREDG